jgi:TRAP-type mannitol/chloroaromatic compound transport system permease small subunit
MGYDLAPKGGRHEACFPWLKFQRYPRESSLSKFLRWAEAIDGWSERLGRWTNGLVLALVLLGAGNVAARYLGKLIGVSLTSNGLLESQWYIFDLVFLWGAAYALKQDEHVRVDIFYKNLSVKGRAWVNLLGTVFFLIPFCLLVIFYSWGSIVNSWQIWESSPDPGGLPRYPIKSMIVVSFALLILQGLAEMIKNWATITGRRSGEAEIHEPNL